MRPASKISLSLKKFLNYFPIGSNLKVQTIEQIEKKGVTSAIHLVLIPAALKMLGMLRGAYLP